MTEEESELSPLKKIGAAGEEANKAISELGLGKTAVILSEGFCPLCKVHGVPRNVLDDGDDEVRPTTTATVNCAVCRIRWRTGVNPENGKDWIEHARGVDGLLLTMSLNPPPEERDEDDDFWWEDD